MSSKKVDKGTVSLQNWSMRRWTKLFNQSEIKLLHYILYLNGICVKEISVKINITVKLES